MTRAESELKSASLSHAFLVHGLGRDFFVAPVYAHDVLSEQDTGLPMSPSKGIRTSRSNTIRDALEADIAEGRLSEGARIEERMVMERFGVSRTPAREAMRELLSTGLVRSVPRQGMIVTGISLPEYVSMLEILVELEGLAARLATRRMTSEQRKQLERAAKACEDIATLNDPVAYNDANRLFHEIIYIGSCNDVLANQLRSMRARMQHPKEYLYNQPGRTATSIAEHAQVVQAILAGDEEGACRAMSGHISSGGNVYSDSIATMARTAQTEHLAELLEKTGRHSRRITRDKSATSG